MSLLSDLAKYIATVIAVDAITVALFLAAGGINLVRLQTERGLYIFGHQYTTGGTANWSYLLAL